MRTSFLGRFIWLALAGLVAASCSRSADQEVQIYDRADGFDLRLRVKAVRGLCHAPAVSRLTNGHAGLVGLDRLNEVKVVRAPPTLGKEMPELLASERARADDVRVFVSRDTVMHRPFHHQISAFPCDAPRAASKVDGILFVNVSVDLPLWNENRRADGGPREPYKEPVS